MKHLFEGICVCLCNSEKLAKKTEKYLNSFINTERHVQDLESNIQITLILLPEGLYGKDEHISGPILTIGEQKCIMPCLYQ